MSEMTSKMRSSAIIWQMKLICVVLQLRRVLFAMKLFSAKGILLSDIFSFSHCILWTRGKDLMVGFSRINAEKLCCARSFIWLIVEDFFCGPSVVKNTAPLLAQAMPDFCWEILDWQSLSRKAAEPSCKIQHRSPKSHAVSTSWS